MIVKTHSTPNRLSKVLRRQCILRTAPDLSNQRPLFAALLPRRVFDLAGPLLSSLLTFEAARLQRGGRFFSWEPGPYLSHLGLLQGRDRSGHAALHEGAGRAERGLSAAPSRLKGADFRPAQPEERHSWTNGYCWTNESGMSITALPPSGGANCPFRATPFTHSTTAPERFPLADADTLDTSPPGPMRSVNVMAPA